MRTLQSRFALDSAEVDTLWLLACIELCPMIATAAQVLFAHGMHELSAQIVEQLAGRAGVLERLAEIGLIETTFDRRVPRHRRPVRIADRVLDVVRGGIALDRLVAKMATLTLASHDAVQINVPRAVAEAVTKRGSLIVATGVEGSGRSELLSRAALMTRDALLVVDGASLSRDGERVERELRAIVREARLHDAALLFREIEDASAEQVLDAIAEVEVAVFATASRVGEWRTTRTVVEVPMALPTGRSRTLEKRLATIATRIETTQTWDDLVLPEDQQDVLLELISRVRNRGLVMNDWGFADKIGRGLGTSVLLSGPPGTGKTMIAGLIAKELRLDLYQVDLSKLVSKYIGETEKQLATLFDAAESGHAILLFDEADSLFGKRTDVKSSNDRYANLEVNYLLQRMEQFSGISILTTNHERAIDAAFQRRLAFHLRVPMPDEDQRARMWTTMIPHRAARAANLNVSRLAEKFEMSGGYIKNAVLRAAFLAAGEGAPIGNVHLERAARLEYEAMGQIVFAAS